MERDYAAELEKRIGFLKQAQLDAHADGFVFNNSGGKDCVLAGIIARAACENTTALMLPCASKRNYGEDLEDAQTFCAAFDIPCHIVDLTPVREALLAALPGEASPLAASNIAPRLRMAAAYTYAQTHNLLVVGTGNRSEIYLGYFTKWGDGAYDVNPIADLTATEVFAFLRYLHAPTRIIEKAPSAGLYDGQTDEGDLGFSYAQLDRFIMGGDADPDVRSKAEAMHARSAHKRVPPLTYCGNRATSV